MCPFIQKECEKDCKFYDLKNKECLIYLFFQNLNIALEKISKMKSELKFFDLFKMIK
jgi:hypothetical protein